MTPRTTKIDNIPFTNKLTAPKTTLFIHYLKNERMTPPATTDAI